MKKEQNSPQNMVGGRIVTIFVILKKYLIFGLASTKMEEKLEEQPTEKKPRIDNPEKEQWKNANDMDLQESTKDNESASSKMDLPSSHPRPLPLELNCEVFKCLKWPIQRKFIWGLGRGIYGIFEQKVLTKSKRLHNPRGNHFQSGDGLNVSNTGRYTCVFAIEGFPTSAGPNRKDNFPGTIVYYYELTQTTPIKGEFDYKFARPFWIGLSEQPMFEDSYVGMYPNSYSYLPGHDFCYLADAENVHKLEWPEDVLKPERELKGLGDVGGCGLLVDPNDKLAIFFTFNGKLIGRQIPISPSVDRLFPALEILEVLSLEANFGDDPAKPFKFDVHNFSGL